MSFISMWAPDNSFCILNRKCKIALSNKSRKEKRDDPAMTASAEALVFPGTERGRCIGLAGPQGLQPWHPPARPARAAGASLLQPSPDSYSLFLYSGISLAGKARRTKRGFSVRTLAGEVGKPFCSRCTRPLRGHPLPFHPAKSALAQGRRSHFCVVVAVVKTVAFLGNMRFKQLLLLDGKELSSQNVSTCCAEHVLTPVHNPVVLEGLFAVVVTCETLAPACYPITLTGKNSNTKLKGLLLII